MLRIALLLASVLLTIFTTCATAADLPPGVIVRLGEDRFRAGGAVDGLVFSPDGEQLLSWQKPQNGLVAVALWEVDTGKRLHEVVVNSDLFCGAAWGPAGAVVVVRRVDVDAKTGRGTLIPDDIRVWNISNPAAFPPPFERLRPTKRDPYWRADVSRPGGLREFREFALSADGRRIAILVRSAITKKYSAEVFELHAADSVARLNRIAALALGDFEVDQLILPPGDHTLWVFPICGPEGDIFSNGSLIRWDLKTGKPGVRIDLFTYPRKLSFSWDGRHHATSALSKNGGVLLIDVASGKSHIELPWPKARQLANDRPSDLLGFSPDGKRLLIALSRELVIIDVATGKESGHLEGHAGEFSAFAVSPDGARIATADQAGLIRIWNAETLRALSKPVGHRNRVLGAELSPDGKRLLTFAKDDETVFVWDLATGTALRGFTTFHALGTRHSIQRPTFTPDGLAIVLSTKDRLIVRDLQTGLEVPLPGEMAKQPAGAAVFAPDGTAVITYPVSGESFSVWDWPSGKKRFRADTPSRSITGAAEFVHETREPRFSADGSAIFVSANTSDRVDAKTGERLPATWTDTPFVVQFASLSLHNRPMMLLGDSDERIVLNADTGKRVLPDAIRPFPTLAQWWFVQYGIAISPNGRFLACGFQDSDAELIEVTSGRSRRVLAGHRGFSRVLGFTPDGSRLLTAGADHSILVWDMRLQAVPLPEVWKRETNAAKLWDMLASSKAKDAYLAMARLVREPAAAVKMTRMRLKPVVRPSEKTLARILHDLGDEEFAVRERAAKELDQYGEVAVAAVKARISQLTSPEARLRCEAFVTKFTGSGADAVHIADARAIELLESLDTEESRTLLKELAGGGPDAFRTQEAKRTLERNKR